MPVGPSSDLWPGNASRSMHIAWMSMGMTPAVWAASTRKSRSCSRASRPISAMGCTVPRTLLACVWAMSLVFGVMALRMASGSTVPPPSAGDARQGDLAGQLHRPQRPADAVVFEVGGDDVIAFFQDALEGHVERVGAVEREDEALRLLAMKELVEPMPAIVEGAFGGQGHLVPGPARIGEVVAGEVVQGLVDRLGLGETRGGVVEVDHDLAINSRTRISAIFSPSRTSGTVCFSVYSTFF